MERLIRARYNNKGMTLIEVMIALLLLAIVALAVMQTALVGMRTNLQNAERDEAVRIVDQGMNELRETPLISIVTGTTTTIISRQFRAATVQYTRTQNITTLNPSNNTISVTMGVSWLCSGQTFTHKVASIMREQ